MHEAMKVATRDVDAVRRVLEPLRRFARDTRLSHGHRRLIQYLWLSAGAQPGTITVGVREAAAEIGADPGTVSRWLDRLDTLGVLHVYDDANGTKLVDLYDPAQLVSGRLMRPDPQANLFEVDAPEQPEEIPDTLPGPGVAPCRPGATGVAPCTQGATPPGDGTHISACARRSLVVVLKENNNNVGERLLDRAEEVKTLARRACCLARGIPPEKPLPPIDDIDRTMMIRLAYLALEHLGEDWLTRAAKARPPGAKLADSPMAFLRAAAANHAYELLNGARPDTADKREEAAAQLNEVLGMIPVPDELRRRAPPEEREP